MRLEIKDVHKSFGEKKVLNGISFAADSGKAFGLLGRNGAGKTTTIRILMDVFPADSGEVMLDGQAIDHHKVGIGYLPEERGLYPKKKIIDQLVYFSELKGMKYADAVKAIDGTPLPMIPRSSYWTNHFPGLTRSTPCSLRMWCAKRSREGRSCCFPAIR